MIPEYIRAIRELTPKAFIFENVKGLLRPAFHPYFDYVTLQFSNPEIGPNGGEHWSEHFERLKAQPSGSGLHYRLCWRLLNAADYGAPQVRQRVLVVGFRDDLSVDWEFPEPTHSLDALMFDQWSSGEYWERHGLRKPPPSAEVLAGKYRPTLLGSTAVSGRQPWRTVRDALEGLPEPAVTATCHAVINHRLNPGARAYAGHTGSPLDLPAKTLKAGDHGVPGGENMLAYPDGSVRYFTVRESARLQTFPDEWIFEGTWSESMRQLGNAVPVSLAAAVARGVAAKLTALDE